MWLIVIVLLNGSEVRLNPSEIVSMVEARDANDPLKRYTPDVRCIVTTTNGVEYATREECTAIEDRLEHHRNQ